MVTYMQRYRTFFIDTIRIILIFVFIYILPTRKIFDFLINSIFNLDNSYFYIIIKLCVLAILYSLFEYIDMKNLYNRYTLKNDFLNRPLFYIIIIFILIELFITIILYISDKNNLFYISSSDWLNYIINMIIINISSIGSAFALYKYLENRQKESCPKVDIRLLKNNSYKYHTNFNFNSNKYALLKINLTSEHIIKDIYIKSGYFESSIYDKNNIKLETIKKNNPVYIKIQINPNQFYNNNRTNYILFLQNENYETYTMSFEIIHNGININNFQIKQDTMRKERL